MSVIIGSARSDERGKLTGGKAGEEINVDFCSRDM